MQAFIFDMDGVIIDSEKVYEQADQKWFAENGIQTDRIALRQCLGCTDDVNWGMIAKWNPDRDIPEIYRQYREFCKEIRVNYRQIYRPYADRSMSSIWNPDSAGFQFADGQHSDGHPRLRPRESV